MFLLKLSPYSALEVPDTAEGEMHRLIDETKLPTDLMLTYNNM